MNSIEKAIERLLKQSSESSISSKDKLETSSVVNDQDVEKAISRNILSFDYKKLQDLGYITPQKSYSQISEEFRIIKIPMLRNAFGKGVLPTENGNLVMVSSSLPGEGKTFVTLNLALSIVAEKNTTVLLVDADVVNPTLSRMLGLADKIGIIDVLQNDAIELEDVIYQTEIDNFKIIPAGKLDPHSTELLASDKMRNICFELSNRYKDRVILFDSPPLLVTSQAVVLSHNMGQILVVIEAGNTPQYTVKEALELLDKNDTVGIVLNKNRSSSFGGYHYGSYHEAANQKK